MFLRWVVLLFVIILTLYISVAKLSKLVNGSIDNITSEMSDSVTYGRFDINVSRSFGDNGICLKFYNSWKNKGHFNGREYLQGFLNICASVNYSANLFFGHNFAYDGGSIFSKNSTIKLVGNIKFVANSAIICGGALLLRNTSIEILVMLFSIIILPYVVVHYTW